jgi:uncharacterized membrane protein
MASELVVLAFDGIDTADSMLDNFREMQERGIIKLEDAVVASRGQSVDLEIHQTDARRGRQATAGAGVGVLAGWLIAGPVGGAAAGSIGAIIGGMRDRGIDDHFVQEVSRSLKPESSAIFLLIEEADGPKVLEELKPFNAVVVHTTLTGEQERKLRDTLQSS